METNIIVGDRTSCIGILHVIALPENIWVLVRNGWAKNSKIKIKITAIYITMRNVRRSYVETGGFLMYTLVNAFLTVDIWISNKVLNKRTAFIFKNVYFKKSPHFYGILRMVLSRSWNLWKLVGNTRKCNIWCEFWKLKKSKSFKISDNSADSFNSNNKICSIFRVWNQILVIEITWKIAKHGKTENYPFLRWIFLAEFTGVWLKRFFRPAIFTVMS